MAKINYQVMEDGTKSIMLSTTNQAEAWFTLYRAVYRTNKLHWLIKTDPNSELKRLREGVAFDFRQEYLSNSSKEFNCTSLQYIGVEMLVVLIERIEDFQQTPKLVSHRGVISGKQVNLVARLASKLFSTCSKELLNYFEESYVCKVFRVGKITSGLIFTKRGCIKF